MAPKALPRKLAWLQPSILVGSLLPLVLLMLRGYLKTLGADPVAVVLNQLGLMGLVFLLGSLSCTPLKLLTGWKWPLRLRKTLGLLSFSMVLMHLLTYVLFDQGASLEVVLKEVQERSFIQVGVLAFLMLLSLALTSSRSALKKIGTTNWRRLHRLAYAAAALGCLHFYMRVKADAREPMVYAGLLALLLGVRVVAAMRKRAPKKGAGVGQQGSAG